MLILGGAKLAPVVVGLLFTRVRLLQAGKQRGHATLPGMRPRCRSPGTARALDPHDRRPTRHPTIRRHVLRVSGRLDARGDAVRRPSPGRIVRHQEAADTMHTRFFQTKPNSPETAATAGPRGNYGGHPTSNRRPKCVFTKQTQTHPSTGQ